MKIIDFEKKGNVVRFYLGEDDNEDYKGDDWNDDDFDRYVGDEKTIKFYFGDKMELSDTLTVFETEGEYEQTN